MVCRYSRGGTCFCVGCCYSRGGTCFCSRGGMCCLSRWVRLVGGGGTVAVRATRLLYWCGWCWGTLHTFENNIEILWQRLSSHLLDLFFRGPSCRPAAARKHQLHDPRWRRGAVKHAPAEVRSCFHPDRILCREGARRCEDVLR